MIVDPIGRHTVDEIPAPLSLYSRTVTRGEGLSRNNSQTGRERRERHRRMYLDGLGLRIAASLPCNASTRVVQ